MEKKPFPIRLKVNELYRVVYSAATQCAARNLFLPSPTPELIDDGFFARNSKLFPKNPDVPPLKEGQGIPRAICEQALSEKGYLGLKQVQDLVWLQRAALASVPAECHQNIVFPTASAKLLGEFLDKGDGKLELMGVISPEMLAEAVAKEIMPTKAVEKKLTKKFSRPSSKLAADILHSAELKCCVICQKPATDLLVTTCCYRSIHRDCAPGRLCPKNCKPYPCTVQPARKLKDVYKFAPRTKEEQIKWHEGQLKILTGDEEVKELNKAAGAQPAGTIAIPPEILKKLTADEIKTAFMVAIEAKEMAAKKRSHSERISELTAEDLAQRAREQSLSQGNREDMPVVQPPTTTEPTKAK
ncbi:MAG: hypothetical protein P4L51_04630 [Puia sp.]|nr:hypothetical protein [Puia sp.]